MQQIYSDRIKRVKFRELWAWWYNNHLCSFHHFLLRKGLPTDDKWIASPVTFMAALGNDYGSDFQQCLNYYIGSFQTQASESEESLFYLLYLGGQW